MEKQIGIKYPEGCGFPEGKICMRCAVKWEKAHVGEYDTDSGRSTEGIFEGEGFSCSLCEKKFGTSAAAAAMGRVKSERKSASSRENGKKGGRPITRSGYLGAELNKFPCQYGIEGEEGLHPCGKPSVYKTIGGKVYFCDDHAPEVAAEDEKTWVKP